MNFHKTQPLLLRSGSRSQHVHHHPHFSHAPLSLSFSLFFHSLLFFPYTHAHTLSLSRSRSRFRFPSLLAPTLSYNNNNNTVSKDLYLLQPGLFIELQCTPRYTSSGTEWASFPMPCSLIVRHYPFRYQTMRAVHPLTTHIIPSPKRKIAHSLFLSHHS